MKATEAFLKKTKDRLDNGEYKKHFTLPFMSEDKLYKAIEKKVNQLEKNGATPILSDLEIDEMIKDMKEASGVAFYLFLEYGFLEATDDGYQMSKKGAKALRVALRM